MSRMILKNQFYLISFFDNNDFTFSRYVTNMMPTKKELDFFSEDEGIFINIQKVGNYCTNEFIYKKIIKRGKINWE